MEDVSILPACEPATTSPPVKTNPPKRILVVESDEDILSLNIEVLTRHGYHADAAGDGAVAWHALKSGGYDLLITEHDVPKVTGIELIKAIRGARMALPVIMATGSLPSWEIICHPWLEPVAVLLKPYTISELVGSVKAVLHQPAKPCEQIGLPLNWTVQPPAPRLRL